MKKSILLLGGAGIAAGVAIALSTTKKKNKGEMSDAENEEQLTSHEEDSHESTSLEAKTSSNEDDQKASMKKLGADSESPATGEIEIDDHGTDQEAASAILERVRDGAFDASDEKLALALGRPTEEVTGWMDGSEIIDGDVLLKVRALAMERGVEVPGAAASH